MHQNGHQDRRGRRQQQQQRHHHVACAPFKLAVQEDVYTTVFNHGPLKVLCSGVLVCVVLPYLGTDTIVIHYIKIPIDHFVVCLGLIYNRVVLAVFFGPWYQGPDNGTRALVRRFFMVNQSPTLNGLGATGLRCYQGAGAVKIDGVGTSAGSRIRSCPNFFVKFNFTDIDFFY